MKINSINQTNFTAKVDHHFIDSTEKYFIKRHLPIQLEQFKKKVDAFEYLGDEKSEIVYVAFPQEEGSDANYLHLLCLKNLNLNKKSAAIIKQTTKFRDLLDCFHNITDNTLQYFEETLKNIQ